MANSSNTGFSGPPLTPERPEMTGFGDRSSQTSGFPVSTLQPVTPKLTDENYRYWRTQALLAAGAHDLEEHLTGLVTCPLPFVYVKSDNDDGDIKTRNSEYYMWKRYDKLLMGWLISSVSENLFSLVSNYSSASEMWTALETYFVTESKVRIMHLKNTLQTLKKGSLSIQEYMRRMKDIFDTLVASGQVLTEEDLVNFILDGLGSDFEPIVVYILARVDSQAENLTLADLKLILQKYEQRLGRTSSLSFDFNGGVANVAKQTSRTGHGYGNYRPDSVVDSNSAFLADGISGQSTRYDSIGQRNFRSFSPGGQGRGRGRNFNKPRVVCQLCGKSGHVVLQCYHRFDIHYTGNNFVSSAQNSTSFPVTSPQPNTDPQNHMTHHYTPVPQYNLNSNQTPQLQTNTNPQYHTNTALYTAQTPMTTYYQPTQTPKT